MLRSRGLGVRQALLTGRRVILSYDHEPNDRYGRFLAYVWLSASRPQFVNADGSSAGLCPGVPFPPNTAHEALFAALERRAALGGRGLWVACG